MSSTQERAEQRRDEKEAAARDVQSQAEGRRLGAVVAAAVMRDLGKPADFIRADARLLWGETYRVNVFAGPHLASARVAHSFFVETDGGGRILSAKPPVKKTY